MPDIQRHLIDAGAAVELFMAKPAGHPKGAMLFVHGNQGGTLLGAREMVDNGTLANLRDRVGIVAASVSQPGFGASEGPADFCGPRTQQAIHAALGFLRDALADADDPVVLYGISRGAVASGMVAAEDADLAALILVAGSYDLAATYRQASPGLRSVIEREAGLGDSDFSARSPLRHAHRIMADTLLVHGRQDDRAPFEQAEQMATALRKAGTSVSLTACDCGHRIPRDVSRAALRPFLARIF